MNWDAVWVPLGTVLTGAIGVASTRVVSKSEERSKARDSEGPRWEAFLDEVKEHTEGLLAERDRRIDLLSASVERLQEEVHNVSRKYRAALEHIGGWRRMFPDSGPVVPEAIKDDL